MNTSVGAPLRLGEAALPALILCLAGCNHAVAEASHGAACLAIPSDGMKTVEISKSGSYCLREDLPWDQSGVAIRISGESIKLDLNGHSIQGRDEVLNQIGVLVDEKSSGISIENGAIKSVQVGVRAGNVSDLRISDVDFQFISWFGVHVSGDNNAVLDSTFSNIGHFYDGQSGDAYAVAILAGGEKMTIQRNEFRNVVRQPVDPDWVGEGVSILVSEGSEDFRIEENLFFNNAERSKNTIGLWARIKNVAVLKNNFNNIERPVEGAYDGVVELQGNKFSTAVHSPSRERNPPGQLKVTPAVAMKFSKGTSGVFVGNGFRGYSCPVKLSGEVSAVKTTANQVDLQGRRLFCDEAGRWQSGLAFIPFPGPKPRLKGVRVHE